MSGVKGQNGPHSLKCSTCKRWRIGMAPSKGDLERTGRTRMQTRRRAPPLLAHQCRCNDCGHVGWYTHHDAARKPLRGS